MKMDTKRKLFWTITLIVGGLALVESQQSSPANVPVREVAAKAGSSANFTCGSNGVPIFICLWERQVADRKFSINIVDDSAVSGTTLVPGYAYTGLGFSTGNCGLLIKNVKDDDNAIWNCKLFTQKGHLFEGNVRVEILKKPNKPEFSTNIQQIKNLSEADQSAKVSVTCGSYGGQPPPTFRWFVGNDEVTDGLQPYENTTYGGQNWIHQTLTGHKFTVKDNGKNLRCLLVHDALGENDVKEVAEKIVVFYPPRADSEIKPFFVPTTGKDVTLSVNISSNPKPQVVWRIGDTVINPMTTKDKYMAYNLVEVSNGVWAGGLLIKSVEEEDLAKVYKLEARNVYGTANFDLRISSSDPEAGGLSAGGIVGLVLGIPALLILIAVIVVYTRARGLLCFKGDDGTASEKERMDGESGGAGVVAEEKPVAQRLSTRLSAIYENLVAKKKDKTAPVEEETNKEKEGIPSDEAAEKKPEDIVYAELDLVNETGGKQHVRLGDDKTEYAEIVGVVPHETKLGEPPKDKSPSGSTKASPKK